jgi:hypothetical protein
METAMAALDVLAEETKGKYGIYPPSSLVCTNLSGSTNRANRTCTDLYVPSEIARIPCPTPLEFLREYVMKNRPVIITDAASHWPALSKWTNEYIKGTHWSPLLSCRLCSINASRVFPLPDALKDQEVTVALTPNGRADAPTVIDGKKYFVLPHEMRMRIGTTEDATHYGEGKKEAPLPFGVATGMLVAKQCPS